MATILLTYEILIIICYFKKHDNTHMGQSSNKQKQEQPPTPEIVDKNVQLLFEDYNNTNQAQIANEPIIIISRNLRLEGSFDQKESGFYVNPTLLKCLYHPNFEKTIKNLMTLFAKQVKTIFSSKVMAMVSREKFRKALNIANFCIFFTNQSLIQTLNLLGVRSDLEPESRKLVVEYTKNNPQINQQMIETIEKEQLFQIAKVFRVSMNLMIDLHLKLITRSDFTLNIIDRLNQSVFVLYVKIFFSQYTDICKREKNENAKNLLKIGAYFLGLGLESKTPSIYQLAVILLLSLIESNAEHLKDQKALPSHLFKSLPIVSNNEMMHWITSNILFALKYVKEGPSILSKLNINRIQSLKLIIKIFEHYKPHSQQITYLLEEICLQTKTFQIERVYVSTMASLYIALDEASDIIKKYAQLGHINFNIKGNKKEVKIKPEDVRTELEDDEDSMRKEMVDLCGKYTVQIIFQKKQILYEYSDKSLWNMILYHMEQEGELIKEAPPQLNKEGEQEQM